MDTDLTRAIQQWRTQSAIGPERYGEIVPYRTLLKLADLLDYYGPIVEAAEALVRFWSGPEMEPTARFARADMLTAALRDSLAAAGERGGRGPSSRGRWSERGQDERAI